MTQDTLGRKARISLANRESRETAPHHRTLSLAVLGRLTRALGAPVTELLE
jgi:hypothetical protein